MIPLTKVRLALLMTATILVAFACAYSTNPVTGKKEFFAYSWQQEIEIGTDADQGIAQEYGIYDDDEIRQYVDRIGQKVLQNSHLRREDAGRQFQDTEFTFRVLDSPIVNAFALPGGYIYVTRGLLAHVENEAQLGVVLGHEIGHVAARHSSQRAFKAQLGQIGLIGGAMLGQAVFDISADEILQLGSSAMQYLFLSYSRDDEREADRLGVEYASKSGYSAGEASRFFRSLTRIQQKTGATIPSWQSTHPDPGDREEAVVQLADTWRTQGYDMSLVNRDPFYNVLDRVVV
ncbi:MAG TPA: peptidase M48, partial [Firmicutes bacterium]|nr:peptidase M48 [Bacillota bacterium]